jgi:hypothetical protein
VRVRRDGITIGGDAATRHWQGCRHIRHHRSRSATMADVHPAPGAESLVQVDASVPLRDSLLWRLQLAFYTRAASRAWTDAIVPNFVTSNAFIASTYAKIILATLRDWFLKCVPVYVGCLQHSVVLPRGPVPAAPLHVSHDDTLRACVRLRLLPSHLLGITARGGAGVGIMQGHD